ncbi:MAG: alkaline phosphatase family protein [Clostridia bacterium]|nr:alkaline phosphatase family protein [Clostridia bacterium]
MRKTVIISLDAMYEKDMEAVKEDSFLGRWMKEAAVCTKVKTVFPALTYPAHTTLVTGCDPDQHGVGQNQPFQPDKQPDMRAWYWQASEVHRESLFDAVKKQGGRCASILWPVTGKHPSLKWGFPEVVALPGENQVLKMLEYGTPLWVLLMELKHGRKRVSSKEPHLSDYAVVLAEDLIRIRQPELLAVHLVDLDDMRHHHGLNSREAYEAMERNQRRVEKIWQAMQDTPGMEDALLVVLSDHGQADVSRTVHLGDVLKAAGLEGCVQVQSNGMSAYLFGADPEKAAQAESWLRENGASCGVSHVYSRGELDKLGCIPEPAFAVEAAPEVVFSDGLPQAKREKATHGFGPGHPAENCLLMIRGRGISPARMDSMPMRDVAPTLAGLMGVSLPDAQGVDHSAEIVE